MSPWWPERTHSLARDAAASNRSVGAKPTLENPRDRASSSTRVPRGAAPRIRRACPRTGPWGIRARGLWSSAAALPKEPPKARPARAQSVRGQVIEISQLYKDYGQRLALGPLSAAIAPGDMLGLLGANVAG